MTSVILWHHSYLYVWSGVVWFGMARYGMQRYGMGWDVCGTLPLAPTILGHEVLCATTRVKCVTDPPKRSKQTNKKHC